MVIHSAKRAIVSIRASVGAMSTRIAIRILP